MNTKRSIFWIFGFALILSLALMSFDYAVDPLCYYHCPKVDLTKRTQNVYYKVAQTAMANADAEILVLGSSRGETTPPHWIQGMTGKKTVNLSQSGGDLLYKMSVLNVSLDAGSKVKKVIWLADYLDLVPSFTDIKMKLTPSLQAHIKDITQKNPIQNWGLILETLINHNTFEAAIEQLNDKTSPLFLEQGMGANIDYARCEAMDFQSEIPQGDLKKNIQSSYRIFSPHVQRPQSPEYWELFKKQVQHLKEKNIELVLLIAPFHPKFNEKLAAEYPETKEYQKHWIADLESLAAPGVQVLNFFDGVPGDDFGSGYWNDGVHLTCKSVMRMLGPQLNSP
ncbi:hypothetical protein AZI86_11165 [Bdellovibrio bacteriovorus]|uniref:Uncharacterized protein n=2 Tax=Bdellovibrio bacteriovorus TaxID=959 RepID=A0A150WL75_BDEBC|nr:hypothetical protein AZI86_11165 [Bdellovibrio bacteriovorus]